jgi:hypothetical protein
LSKNYKLKVEGSPRLNVPFFLSIVSLTFSMKFTVNLGACNYYSKSSTPPKRPPTEMVYLDKYEVKKFLAMFDVEGFEGFPDHLIQGLAMELKRRILGRIAFIRRTDASMGL